MPKPPPRWGRWHGVSRDGEVELPSGATATTAASGGNREELLAAASRMRAAAKQTLGAATRQWHGVSADGEVELLPSGELSSEARLREGYREFVENARVKREEFVNVIKMRRRY